jgi:hypothetical protein
MTCNNCINVRGVRTPDTELKESMSIDKSISEKQPTNQSTLTLLIFGIATHPN